jgi:type IV fimbrial biogenesis protein FimT
VADTTDTERALRRDTPRHRPYAEMPAMNRVNTRCSGRSLVELLAALTVAAVLTAAAVPSYSMLMRDTRLTAAAGDLHNMLFMARSEAVKRGQTVQIETLSGTTSWADGARMFLDSDGDGVKDAGEEILWLSTPIPDGYSLSGPFAALRFTPSGTLSVAPTVVSFAVCKAGASGSTGRTVAVAQTGRPSVTESTCS